MRYNEQVKSELAHSLTEKKINAELEAECNLFLFKNSEYLEKCVFEPNEKISRVAFLKRLKQCFSNEEKCNHFIDEMKRLDLAWERNGNLNFLLNRYIKHPTKVDKNNSRISIHFADFKKLENKSDWI